MSEVIVTGIIETLVDTQADLIQNINSIGHRVDKIECTDIMSPGDEDKVCEKCNAPMSAHSSGEQLSLFKNTSVDTVLTSIVDTQRTMLDNQRLLLDTLKSIERRTKRLEDRIM